MAISLKAARVNAGFTQKGAIAEYNSRNGAKLSQSTLVNWERGKTFPTVLQFKKLCELYGVAMSDIFVPETLL